MAEKLTRKAFFRETLRTLERPAREIGRALREPDIYLVRPPGAVIERDFLRLCGPSCRQCVTACPYGAIVKAGNETGSAAGTAYISPESLPCYLCAGLPCVSACPSGALLPVESAESVRMGKAVVTGYRCLNLHGQDCDACLQICPLGEKAIWPGPRGIPHVEDSTCTGCGQCVHVCPAEPRAIRLDPVATAI